MPAGAHGMETHVSWMGIILTTQTFHAQALQQKRIVNSVDALGMELRVTRKRHKVAVVA
jgi:hypothetical protein